MQGDIAQRQGPRFNLWDCSPQNRQAVQSGTSQEAEAECEASLEFEAGLNDIPDPFSTTITTTTKKETQAQTWGKQ